MQENESTEINNMCDENNVFDLKKYLLSNFFDTKYKKRCLIEIYVLDRKYFDELNRKKLIRSEAIEFFKRKEVAIRNAEAISIDAFRKLQYEKIVDSYIKIQAKNTKFKKIQQEKQDNESAEKLLCYVFQKAKGLQCKKCGQKLVKKQVLFTPKGKQVYFCEHCKLYYTQYNLYKKYKNRLKAINPVEVEAIEKWLLEKQKKKNKIEKRMKKREVTSKKKYVSETGQKFQKQKQNWRQEYAEFLEKRKLDEIARRHNTIQPKDFVVRQNIFKCRNNTHKLVNIDATVKYVDKNGEVLSIEVPAGYCVTCDTFFLMESTYQIIQKRGTPICRISDEKTYLSRSEKYGRTLAQKSVLMQYGYNVSQQNNLSVSQRRKILTLLVDNNILTRSEIIGYLDFFINQRKSLYNYELAIVKWENDKEYISEYRKGQYQKYDIGEIHWKHS